MKFCKTAQIQIIGEKDKIKETVNQYVKAMNYVSYFARENNIYSKNTNDDRSASMNIRDRAVVPRYIRRTRAMCQLAP